MQTDTYIYILEFKLDESAEKAIQQIQKKGYIEKYQTLDKQIAGLGINFSSTTKNVENWKTKSYWTDFIQQEEKLRC